MYLGAKHKHTWDTSKTEKTKDDNAIKDGNQCRIITDKNWQN